MDDRFPSIAALAASQHSVVSVAQLDLIGVSPSLCSKWVRRGLFERLGPRSLAIGGSAPTWLRALSAASFDLDGAGFVAGRSAAQLMGLDGFRDDEVELVVPRCHRGRLGTGVVRSTRLPIRRGDVQLIEGLRVLRAERLILDAPLFRFSQAENENAIDAAIRLRLVSEQRLRTRVITEHRSGINGSRRLLDALVDTGGESRLERWFLRICREAGLPRPVLQKVYRADGRTIARVDAEFPVGLVVEVAGDGTHATRRQRQHDAERHTELTLRGKRVLTFTYDDVRDRPSWMVDRLRRGLDRAA
jgi:hypothetical protein